MTSFKPTSLKLISLAAVALAAAACQPSLADDVDVANATGDAMASLDEAAIGGGLAFNEVPLRRTPEFQKPGLQRRILDALFPSAYAGTCWTDVFSACAAGVETRTFASCLIGLDTIDGTVMLTYSDTAACGMITAGDSVTRSGTITATGFEGGTLTVSSPGGGQVLTNTGGGDFTYQVLGMERVAVGPGGHTLFDISTSTSVDIGVSGVNRATRVIDGGTLDITHNILKYTAALSPQNVAWSATCNCAVSGTWSGTLSGSRSGTYALELTGCGTANLTVGNQTTSVELDRCGAL